MKILMWNTGIRNIMGIKNLRSIDLRNSKEIFVHAGQFNSKKIKDNIQTDDKLIEQIKKKLNI